MLTIVSTKSDIRRSLHNISHSIPSFELDLAIDEDEIIHFGMKAGSLLDCFNWSLWQYNFIGRDLQHRQSDIHCHYIWRKWPRIKSDNVSFQHNFFEGYFRSQNKFCVCQLSIFCFHLHFKIVNYLNTLLFLQTENILKVNNIPATNRKRNPRG